MRFGNWRGVTLALGIASAAALSLALAASPARAQGFHTIPRLTPAVDLNTGQPYYAPPIPNGHYAGKNIGGKISGKVHGLLGGLKSGHGMGLGSGCGSCGGAGCDACGGADGGKWGHGLFKHKGLGLGAGCGLCGGAGCGSCLGHATTVMGSPQGAPSPQEMPMATPQCGDPGGCGLLGKHKLGCGLFGKKCAPADDSCGDCGGAGCGSCGGKPGLGGICQGCGGAGCGLCSKGMGLVNHLLGRDKIKWFNGPGGPVPLTPGYVPYVNVTRSPRDFFAFPPMTP